MINSYTKRDGLFSTSHISLSNNMSFAKEEIAATTMNNENVIPLMENPSFNQRMKNLHMEYQNEKYVLSIYKSTTFHVDFLMRDVALVESCCLLRCLLIAKWFTDVKYQNSIRNTKTTYSSHYPPKIGSGPKIATYPILRRSIPLR